MNREILAWLCQRGERDVPPLRLQQQLFPRWEGEFHHPWGFHAAHPQETLTNTRAQGGEAHTRAATSGDHGVRLALKHQHLPVPLLKGKNQWQRGQVRAGTTPVSCSANSHAHSPSLLMSGEETHVPWDTGSFTLLSVGEEAKLQLILVCG